MTVCPCCGQAAEQLRLSEARTVLSPIQLRILESLERRKVARMDEIVDDVWGDDINGGPLDTRTTMNVHICNIRKRLRSAGIPYTVRNVWGVGYKVERAA